MVGPAALIEDRPAAESAVPLMDHGAALAV